jgi:hypothetical protein
MWIRQHSAVLFHVMGHHCSGLFQGMGVASEVVRNGMTPRACARPLPEGLFTSIPSGKAEIPFAGSDGAGPISMGSGEAESAAPGSAKPGPTPLGSGESEALPSGSGEANFPSRGRISLFRDP